MEKVNTYIKIKSVGHTSFWGALVVAIAMLSIVSCKEKEVSEPIIEVPEPTEPVLPDTLKIISYNILEGMKNDKANNYNKFVEWIKLQAPDVLALQEVNGFNQRELEKLAKRYGHNYVITNLKSTDNYPVALTSKYPIESRRRITLHVSHGAIFARLKNTDLNIVVTHFWPQAYWKTVGDNLGNDYRLQEANVVLDSTIRKFTQEKDWVFMGDFNSVSRRDYDPAVTTNNYWAIDEIMGAGYVDAIHYLHGNKEDGSAKYDFQYPGRRIDFIFGTESVLKRGTKAMPIYDEFTKVYSDHPPMMFHLLL
ncbi:endonuclease/exonuclease/phosphatase family protein [Sphingobacterium faecale]|uniref:Endonuclease/exonuclease/phosphatase family protein n=1 Tax=Sphingobacterium faecale TaxID=2803775 RepID=A0ABS1R906_9SPHI|nr:endonuclease/exonuclease/phosphatase family protein [Sphingobacterium faecale]MBL1411029.1 endonuclease/exonuclease/phosphatase family protein [Sphingobacterium faecale]